MAAYIIGLHRSAPRETAWLKEYLPKTVALIAKHGGKPLIGGNTTPRLLALEGAEAPPLGSGPKMLTNYTRRGGPRGRNGRMSYSSRDRRASSIVFKASRTSRRRSSAADSISPRAARPLVTLALMFLMPLSAL